MPLTPVALSLVDVTTVSADGESTGNSPGGLHFWSVDSSVHPLGDDRFVTFGTARANGSATLVGTDGAASTTEDNALGVTLWRIDPAGANKVHVLESLQLTGSRQSPDYRVRATRVSNTEVILTWATIVDRTTGSPNARILVTGRLSIDTAGITALGREAVPDASVHLSDTHPFTIDTDGILVYSSAEGTNPLRIGYQDPLGGHAFISWSVVNASAPGSDPRWIPADGDIWIDSAGVTWLRNVTRRDGSSADYDVHSAVLGHASWSSGIIAGPVTASAANALSTHDAGTFQNAATGLFASSFPNDAGSYQLGPVDADGDQIGVLADPDAAGVWSDTLTQGSESTRSFGIQITSDGANPARFREYRATGIEHGAWRPATNVTSAISPLDRTRTWFGELVPFDDVNVWSAPTPNPLPTGRWWLGVAGQTP